MFDSKILHRSLSLIEDIYRDTMYDDQDYYRIVDVIHALDINQYNSKKWLADVIKESYQVDGGKILVIGGWYGTLAHLLREVYPSPDINITSIDMDSKTTDIAWKLFHDDDISFEIANINDYDISEFTCIINTSCEHMTKRDLFSIDMKRDPDCLAVYQSNNMYHIPSHINCHNSVEHFKRDIVFGETYYENTLNLSDGYERYMIIGK